MENRVLNKIFLIYTKYTPHFLAFVYGIYTLLGFFGVDWNIVGCLFHVSLMIWVQLLFTSYRFKYCYVHRLPIYYIGINELITAVDYYLNIPISDLTLLAVHSLIIVSLIFGYSYYYVKYKIK